MSLIKLSAIDSTNDYLKVLSRNQIIENFTTVVAEKQTQGKGQMGATWISEEGKNLIMSILIKEVLQDVDAIFHLNVAVALSIFEVLNETKVPNLSIKWPNDIMSDSKKVAGILIENIVKPDGSFTAIVGVGLNLNQTIFENLPQATSLKCITGKTYESEHLALLLKDSLLENMETLNINSDLLWSDYHENLYKKDYPSPFEDKNGNRFMGIIKKVTRDGKLEVILEDDSILYFEVKEVKMLY